MTTCCTYVASPCRAERGHAEPGRRRFRAVFLWSDRACGSSRVSDGHESAIFRRGFQVVQPASHDIAVVERKPLVAHDLKRLVPAPGNDYSNRPGRPRTMRSGLQWRNRVSSGPRSAARTLTARCAVDSLRNLRSHGLSVVTTATSASDSTTSPIAGRFRGSRFPAGSENAQYPADRHIAQCLQHHGQGVGRVGKVNKRAKRLTALDSFQTAGNMLYRLKPTPRWSAGRFLRPCPRRPPSGS